MAGAGEQRASSPGPEGKLGGEFFTPRCIVRLLVEMLEPYEGRVYDPCCGSAGMFVQSERFVEAHGGQKTDISIFGQESNPTTWRLAHMNLAIRGIVAGFIMANGSLSSGSGGEGESRQRIVETDLVDCIVALPAHCSPAARKVRLPSGDEPSLMERTSGMTGARFGRW